MGITMISIIVDLPVTKNEKKQKDHWYFFVDDYNIVTEYNVGSSTSMYKIEKIKVEEYLKDMQHFLILKYED